MDLGSFSISLAVKDLAASQAFYEKFGFERFKGSKEGEKMGPGMDWAILRNGNAIIGLFQGMFKENIITFHPDDVRTIAAEVAKKGVALELKNMYGPLTDTSPAYATIKDPDGNEILIDQLVESGQPSLQQ